MKEEPEESAAQEDALPDDCVQPSPFESMQPAFIPVMMTPPSSAVPTPNGYLPAINGSSTTPLSMTTPLIPTALVQPSLSGSMQLAFTPVMMTPPSSAVPTSNGYLPAYNGCSTAPPSMTTPLHTPLVQPSLSGSMQLAFTPVMMTPPSSAVPTSNGYLPAYNGCSTAPPSMTTPLHTPLVQTSPSVYSTVMMPPSPSAVPASNCFPTMNGCLPALPPTTTPLPTLLTPPAKSGEGLSKAVKQRIERNRQKAIILRRSKLVPHPYAKEHLYSEDTTIKIGSTKFKDTGGGFLLEENSYEKPLEIVPDEAPICEPDRPNCVNCNKPIGTSWLLENFHSTAVTCKDPEVHKLITKTEAKETYLLKDCDFDKREPPLKFIQQKNPHNHRWGDMKLYLQIQVTIVPSAI
nr:unnamed protein product [Callosobruchus chinensis]